MDLGNELQRLIYGIITAVVVLLVGVALGPTVIDACGAINTTSMADVTMGTVIVTLATYVPFFYYIGIVLGAMASVWAVVKVQT